MHVNYKEHVNSSSFVSGTEYRTFKKAEIPQGTIQMGDIVVWKDPDVSYNNEDYTQQLFIGEVKRIYDIEDRDMEISISAPIGRISMQNITAISGREIYYYRDGHKCDMKFVDQFLNSDYHKYMSVAWTYEDEFVKDGK